MNSSFAFAALAVISAFPFLAVSSAAVGGDIRSAIVARMGLNVKATHDVNLLFATGNQAVATLTWVSCIVLVGGAIGMASTLQNWYHRIYEQTQPKGLLRHLVYQVAGVAAFTLYISAEVWLLGRGPRRGRSGPHLLAHVRSGRTLWWWWAYMLLYRPGPPHAAPPRGSRDRGLRITGLGVVSWLIFSDQVTSGQKSYGPAGVVIALISFLVGFGVCLHLGAVFGRMWTEWRAERAAALDEA